MTPMLVLLFGVQPSAAISSDLVAAVVMRPVGGLVHLRRGSVNLKMVGWLTAGSVPAAFLGAYLLQKLGGGKSVQNEVEIVLGAALLLGSTAIIVRSTLQPRIRRREGATASAGVNDVTVKPLPTLAIGMLGGVMVGMTSVGSGSLMVILLLFVYPALRLAQLVGTDLIQAVPLTAAAALGNLIFGHVEFAVTASLLVGSIPAVYVGARFSSRAPDRILRPALAFVLFASGLKLVGLGATDLAWVLGPILLVGAVAAGVARSRRRSSATREVVAHPPRISIPHAQGAGEPVS